MWIRIPQNGIIIQILTIQGGIFIENVVIGASSTESQWKNLNLTINIAIKDKKNILMISIYGSQNSYRK